MGVLWVWVWVRARARTILNFVVTLILEATGGAQATQARGQGAGGEASFLFVCARASNLYVRREAACC